MPTYQFLTTELEHKMKPAGSEQKIPLAQHPISLSGQTNAPSKPQEHGMTAVALLHYARNNVVTRHRIIES